MAKNTTLKVGLVIAVLVIGYMAYAGGMFGNLGGTPAATVVTQYTPPPGTATTTTVSTTGSGLHDGDLVTVNVNAIDALTGASYTEATNTKSTWLYKGSSGPLVIQTTGTAKTIKTSYDGKIWASFETQASGQTFIFSTVATAQSESTFSNDCLFMDIEGDGTKEYVCSFTTANLTPQQANFGVIPTRNFNTAWYDYTAATVSAPADVTSIGTAAGTSAYTTWTLTNTVGDISQITRIQYKINSTSDSKWTAGEMYVKFKDIPLQFSLSDFRKWQDGTSTYYECLLGPTGDCTNGGYATGGYQIDKAFKLPYAVNGPGTHAIEVKNYWNLATSDVLVTTLIIDQTNELSGAVTALSDAKTNSA